MAFSAIASLWSFYTFGRSGTYGSVSGDLCCNHRPEEVPNPSRSSFLVCPETDSNPASMKHSAILAKRSRSQAGMLISLIGQDRSPLRLILPCYLCHKSDIHRRCRCTCHSSVWQCSAWNYPLPRNAIHGSGKLKSKLQRLSFYGHSRGIQPFGTRSLCASACSFG